MDQNETSLAKQVFDVQESDPRKDDWISTVKSDMKKLNLDYTFNEINNISKITFKNIIRKATENAALKNLTLQVKSKGKEIKYDKLEMQNYLKSD